jgi:predicted SprT family Zn-dependent metalloprotease
MRIMLASFLILVNILIWSSLHDTVYRDTALEFRDYISRFESYYGKPIKTSIIFNDLSGETIGTCFYTINAIEIDTVFWNNSDDITREELILHELAHCVLHKDHNNNMLENNCPESIMHEYTYPGCYEKNKAYYIKELFDK